MLVERLAELVKRVKVLDIVLGLVGLLCNAHVHLSPLLNKLALCQLGHSNDYAARRGLETSRQYRC